MNNISRIRLRPSVRTTQFSVAEAITEAEQSLGLMLEEFHHYFDPDRVDAIVEWRDGPDRVPDLVATPIGHALATLYAYGIEGVLEAHTDPLMLVHLASPFVDRMAIERSINDTAGGELLCRRLIDTAFARWNLDVMEPRAVQFENHLGEVGSTELSIREVALLANMDEKSVRNAAYEKSEGALQTSLRDGRVYVAVLEARRWLAERRGFRPTCLITAQDVSTAIPVTGFRSARDLGAFIQQRRAVLSLSISELAQRIDRDDVAAADLQALETAAVAPLPAAAFVALGRALGLQPAAFTSAALHAQINELT